MTTYPLPTLAAQVTATGISAPSYADILASLKASLQSIYGSDAYLEPDSQDGQMLAIFASAINDANNMAIAVYNAFSPATAQGTGLSSVVKINGLARLIPSNSSATVNIVGQAGTQIVNGLVEDENGNKWALPALVTVPVGGLIAVTATAVVSGAISAAAGTINVIATPTRGWQSVTNPADAVVGAPVEDDATLRRRQSVSTSLAAVSVLDAMVGAIANLSGVTMWAAYENDTGSTNSLGIPAHSISMVVEGGDAQTIAQMIAQQKTPGTGTYGTTTETVYDQLGVPSTIHFFAPTHVTLTVVITVKALPGFVTPTQTAIAAAAAAYIAGLGIGAGTLDGTDKVYLSRVEAVAALMGSGVEKTFNITSVQLSRTGAGGLAAADVAIAFNELAKCDASTNVTVTVT